jgi:hypothetical protein
MKPTITILLLAALAAAPLAPALAQQSTAPPQATPVPPPATAAPQSDDGAGEGSSLSDRLSRSKGVVRPPPTGDSGVLPPPPAGAESTPIIRPPGTRGGNEDVQPKP